MSKKPTASPIRAPAEVQYAAEQPNSPIELRVYRGANGAYTLYQDENDNHSVDRNILGLPREPIGFSNNAPIRFAPPAFRDAALAFSGGEESISLRLRHFL